MGRRRDDPRDQKAKGFPGKRKGKTERALAALEKTADRDAKLFAEAGANAELVALPMFLQDRRLAAAQRIWQDYAPRLDKLLLLTTLDRHTFAMFCIYAAEFVLANRDILDKGHTIMVTTVAGAKSRAKAGSQMPRENPAVSRRDFAAKMMLDLAEKFGFTPLDRAKLIQAHAMREDEGTLFGRVRSPAQPAGDSLPAAPTQETGGDIVGRLGELDSTPPGQRPN